MLWTFGRGSPSPTDLTLLHRSHNVVGVEGTSPTGQKENHMMDHNENTKNIAQIWMDGFREAAEWQVTAEDLRNRF